MTEFQSIDRNITKETNAAYYKTTRVCIENVGTLTYLLLDEKL